MTQARREASVRRHCPTVAAASSADSLPSQRLAAGVGAGEHSIFDFSVRQYGNQVSLDAYKGKVRRHGVDSACGARLKGLMKRLESG